jgi:hypothetical protein
MIVYRWNLLFLPPLCLSDLFSLLFFFLAYFFYWFTRVHLQSLCQYHWKNMEQNCSYLFYKKKRTKHTNNTNNKNKYKHTWNAPNRVCWVWSSCGTITNLKQMKKMWRKWEIQQNRLKSQKLTLQRFCNHCYLQDYTKRINMISKKATPILRKTKIKTEKKHRK